MNVSLSLTVLHSFLALTLCVLTIITIRLCNCVIINTYNCVYIYN